ncbi:uncharacterized protein LOC142504586 isoform X2 [Primulina tabacum]|uniref:uncharacterized protein LOC142504586 isoform X2 n=1 Tax=Primulina tabacum TaxID=48773 RepID=UPI003F59F697
MQMWIVDTDHDIDNRLHENPGLRRELLLKIQNILDEHNPFVHVFRQIGKCQDIPNCRLIIRQQKPNEHQYSLPTTSQVAAVIVDNECQETLSSRDITIQGIGGNLISIQDVVGYYDPLQYPLLLPYGTYGWDINTRNNDGTRITCLNYYAYMLQIRENSPSLLLRGGRLLQQYAVDNYVKIETQRLRWICSNQRDIRSELYQGLQDCLHGGENNAGNVGTRVVLPSSFGGSPRDMYQRYQDATNLVQTYGKLDLMLTMTCNPNWNEIKYQLLPGQSPQDRPDLITRIFRSKFEEFKKDIVDRGVLEISQIVQEAQKSVGWFQEDKESLSARRFLLSLYKSATVVDAVKSRHKEEIAPINMKLSHGISQILCVVLLMLFCIPHDVTAGDIVQDNELTPKIPGCANYFVLVEDRIKGSLARTLGLRAFRCGEGAMVSERFGESDF